MSVPQVPESGGPAPRNGPGRRRVGDSGMGVASLACGALILPSLLVMMVPAAFVSLFTRPDHGRSGREWVASTVLFGPAVSLTLFSLLFGLLAVGGTCRGSPGYRTGAVGLVVAVIVAGFMLVPSLLHGY